MTSLLQAPAARRRPVVDHCGGRDAPGPGPDARLTHRECSRTCSRGGRPGDPEAGSTQAQATRRRRQERRGAGRRIHRHRGLGRNPDDLVARHGSPSGRARAGALPRRRARHHRRRTRRRPGVPGARRGHRRCHPRSADGGQRRAARGGRGGAGGQGPAVHPRAAAPGGAASDRDHRTGPGRGGCPRERPGPHRGGSGAGQGLVHLPRPRRRHHLRSLHRPHHRRRLPAHDPRRHDRTPTHAHPRTPLLRLATPPRPRVRRAPRAPAHRPPAPQDRRHRRGHPRPPHPHRRPQDRRTRHRTHHLRRRSPPPCLRRRTHPRGPRRRLRRPRPRPRDPAVHPGPTHRRRTQARHLRRRRLRPVPTHGPSSTIANPGPTADAPTSTKPSPCATGTTNASTTTPTDTPGVQTAPSASIAERGVGRDRPVRPARPGGVRRTAPAACPASAGRAPPARPRVRRTATPMRRAGHRRPTRRRG